MRRSLLMLFVIVFPWLTQACVASAQTLTATLIPPTRTATIPASATPIPPSETSTVLPASTPTQITLTPDPAIVAGVAGKWQGDNGSFFLLQPDGKWHWDQAVADLEKSPEHTGDWWVEGDVLYLIDRTGPGKCPESFIGSYRVSFDATDLVLVRVNDRCGVRVRQTQGHYTPVQ